MPDRQHLDADPRSEYASNIEKDDPGRDHLQLTRSGILCIERMNTDPNFACLHEVGHAGVGGLLRLGGACDDGGERQYEKQLFHARLQESDVHRERPRTAQCKDAFLLSYTA